MRHPQRNPTPDRSGFTLIELAVAATLLGTVFVVTLPLLKHVRVSRDAAQQQFIAQQEAANILERFSINPSSDAMVEMINISPEAASHLPDADATITVQPTDDGLHQVTVSVSWVNASGDRPMPTKLSAWFSVSEETP